jgi:hypothetical protein
MIFGHEVGANEGLESNRTKIVSDELTYDIRP